MLFTAETSLNIIPEVNSMFSAILVDYLNENGISLIYWVPSVFINVASLNIFKVKNALSKKHSVQ